MARAFLGSPGSSAVLERYIGEARKLASLQRGSLDPAFMNTILSLRGCYDHTPDGTPAHTEETSRLEFLVRPKELAKMQQEDDLISGLEEGPLSGLLDDFL